MPSRSSPRLDALADVCGALADLVLQRVCGACRQPLRPGSGSVLCRGCGTAFACPAEQLDPAACLPALPPTWCAAPYGGAVRTVLLAHKERGHPSLCRLLGAALATAIRAAAQQHGPAGVGLLAVGVPAAAAALRTRRDDPVLRLCRAGVRAARLSGVPLQLVPALTHGRAVRDQAGLSARERAANVEGALRLRRSMADRLAGRHVLLLDDVVTTGATLGEAARVLRGAGAEVVGAACVAAPVRSLGRREAAPWSGQRADGGLA